MMSILCRVGCVLILTYLVPTVAFANERELDQSKTSVEGTWGVTKCEASGKPVELAWTWIFKPDGKASLFDRKAGKQSVFKYTVDRSKNPQQITIEYLGPDRKLQGSKQLGILKLSEGVLVMNLNLPEVKTVPTEFKTAEGSGFLMEMEFMPTE